MKINLQYTDPERLGKEEASREDTCISLERVKGIDFPGWRQLEIGKDSVGQEKYRKRHGIVRHLHDGKET